jgi:hypothetical protein
MVLDSQFAVEWKEGEMREVGGRWREGRVCGDEKTDRHLSLSTPQRK